MKKCCADCKHVGYSDSTGSKCVSSLNCIKNDYCKFEKEDDIVLKKRYIKTESQKKDHINTEIKAGIFILLTIIFFICVIWTSIGGIIYAFQNPELTRTQLMIWSFHKYIVQELYILGFLLFYVIYIIVR